MTREQAQEFDLQKIYRERVTQAVREPRYKTANLSATPGAAVKKNIVCGDAAVCAFSYDSAENRLQARWDGEGCVICLASAELGCAEMDEKTPAQVRKILYDAFTFFPPVNAAPAVTAPFSGVKAVPERLQCVKLFWSAAREAFAPYEEIE